MTIFPPPWVHGARLALARGAWSWLFAPALALGVGLPGASAQDRGRFYSLAETREARELMERAREHLASPQRRRLAFPDLARLLERHRGDVLPQADGRSASHLGAAEWARLALMELSPAGLEEYAAEFGERAQGDLEAALARADAKGLLELARRWPVAPAAERAWWALGDLEWERGHPHEAQMAWEQGRRLAEVLRLDRTAEWAAREAASQNHTGGPEDAFLGLPAADELPGPLPGAQFERFALPLPAGPFGDNREPEAYNLFPVLWDDRLFVSTGLSVVAANALDGELLWQSDEPAGWSQLSGGARAEFFSGLDRGMSMVAPAVGSGVVVAALQIPRYDLDNADFQGIVITVRLPERRLFAFDAADGKPLWNHVPTAGIDLEAQGIAARMHVAGPPVVAGSRVLVPLVSMQGRVELHLACFELSTGTLQWSTSVLSGQRELNMFNRHEREYSAPPVHVEGHRVLVLTQLGTLAAFDLFSGNVLWQSAYDQIALPPSRGWSPPERRREWKTAPPVVADGVVLATPADSEDLIAVSLEDGTVLWSMPHERLRPMRASDYSVDTLLGTREDSVILGGGWIATYRKPGSLRSQDPGTFHLPEFELGRRVEDSPDRRPRPVLSTDGVLVAGPDRLELIPFDGARIDESRSVVLEPEERGNLLVGEGALYSLNGRWLHGFVDLAQLEERLRARLAEAPGDTEALGSLARISLRRVETLVAAGSLRLGIERLAQVRAPMEAQLEHNPGRSLVEQLGQLARREAELLAAVGESEEALVLLEEVLARAETTRERADVLLEMHPLLLGLDRTRWLALLDRIDAEARALDVSGVALARVDPLWTSFAHASSPKALAPVPLVLWIAVQRALDAERYGDPTAALEHWHAALDRARNVELAENRSAGERIQLRIGELLASAGAELYAPFEERAQRDLDDALRRRDGRALESLVRRYPFARAATAARRSLVDLALERGDVAALVQYVLAASPAERPGANDGAAGSGIAVERDQAQLLALLAVGLGRAGNRAFEEGLLASLAENHGELVLDVEPYRGMALEQWRGRTRGGLDGSLWERSQLDASLVTSARLSAPRVVVGQLPEVAPEPESTRGPAWIQMLSGAVEAFADGGDETPLWSAPLERSVPLGRAAEYCQLFSNRVAVLQGESVLGLDARDGRAVWRVVPDSGQVLDLASASGVLLLRTWTPEVGFAVLGVEPTTGITLWEVALPAERKWGAPIAGERYAVFASEAYGVNSRLVVLDVFRGAVLGTFDLDENLGPRATGWIQNGRLYLPSFVQQRLVAFDLVSKRVPWTLRLAAGMDLYGVVRQGDGVYLVAQPRTLGPGAPAGELIAVDLATGGARTVHQLGPDDRLLGVDQGRRTDLQAPFLFVASPTQGAVGTPVAAIHLPSGRRWTQRLPVQAEELYEGIWPAPVVAKNLCILPYVTRDTTTRNRRAVHLVLLDLSNGARRDARVLHGAFTRVEDLTLLSVGDALWISGWSASRGDGRFEIWRPR